MPATVPSSKALALTEDRVLEILQLKLSDEIDTTLGRGSGDYTSGGIYLPDPDRYHREAAPDREQTLEVESMAVWVGQRGAETYGEFRNTTSGGRLVHVDIPYAATFAFAPLLAHPPVPDPVQSGDLPDEQIPHRRGQLYRAAIAHTLSKWGTLGSGNTPRANAVKSTDLETTFSTVRAFRSGPDSVEVRGGGYIEFTASQWQIHPSHDQT
jgi:hypothetical protein